MARELLLDPTADAGAAGDDRLAPRPRTLRGARVGLLDNTKPNASVLLAEVARQLRRDHDVGEVTTYVKGYFGTPVEESQIQQMLKNCDFVVAGIGD